MTTVERQYPVVLAYSLPAHLLADRLRNLSCSWVAPCPYCHRIHTHGTSEGTRVSHCPPDTKDYAHEFEGRTPPSEYFIKFAGEAPKEIVNWLVAKDKRKLKRPTVLDAWATKVPPERGTNA